MQAVRSMWRPSDKAISSNTRATEYVRPQIKLLPRADQNIDFSLCDIVMPRAHVCLDLSERHPPRNFDRTHQPQSLDASADSVNDTDCDPRDDCRNDDDEECFHVVSWPNKSDLSDGYSEPTRPPRKPFEIQ